MFKKVALVMALSFSALAIYAGTRGWQTISFKMDLAPINETIDAMRAEGDVVLKDIETDNPQFQSEFADSFNKLSLFALNAIKIPTNVSYILETPIHKNDCSHQCNSMEYATYILAKMIKNFEIFVLEGTVRPLSQPNKAKVYHYKICEVEPTLCENGEGEYPNDTDYNYLDSDSREFIFARRLLAHPTFVNKMCPIITPYMVWYLNWGWWPSKSTSEEKTRALAPMFYRMHKLLDTLYGDGQWSKENLKKFSKRKNADLDPQIIEYLEKRYMDGGPELMMAYRNCLSSVENAMVDDSTTSGSDAAIEIGKLFKFVKVPSLKVEMASFGNSYDFERNYRLGHFWRWGQKVPEEFIEFEKIDMDSDIPYAYLSTITGFGTRAGPIDIVAKLNQVDAVFKYRLLTFPEFGKLPEDQQTKMKEAGVCLPEQDLFSSQNPKAIAYQVYEEGDFVKYKDLNETYCGNTWHIVREKK